MDKGVLIDNPALNEEPRKHCKNDMTRNRLTLDESLKLLESAYKYNEHCTRNVTLVLSFLTSATRVGELINLREKDIIWERDIFNVCGKSGYRRRIITPGLKVSVLELINDPLRIKALIDSPERYIFYSTKGKGGPMTFDEINDLLKEFARLAGIPKSISSYWLRRTFATELAQSGISIRTIQELFDHDRIKNTETYIAEIKRMNIKKAVDNSSVALLIADVTRDSLRLARHY